MPRITSKQKEERAKRDEGKRPSSRPGPSRPGAGRIGASKGPFKPDGDKKKKGFQVGPAHAPKNAYLGKGELINGPLCKVAHPVIRL
jgi:hypothetical protein